MSKRANKRSIPTYEKFHQLLLANEVLRKKLYEKFGRVRCYMYKTGRTTPNPVTAKILERMTKIPADSWNA